MLPFLGLSHVFVVCFVITVLGFFFGFFFFFLILPALQHSVGGRAEMV